MKTIQSILPGPRCGAAAGALISAPGNSPAAAKSHVEFRKAAVLFWKLLGSLTAKRWVWRAAIAGLCGNLTHTLLMLGKAKLGILESFQPYQSLQIALSYSTGGYIHPLVPWLLSYINGSTAAGFIFANLYHRLPGGSGPVKGFIAGVLGWLVMDLIFFPLLGLGPLAMHVGLGLWPALFSFGMMQAYSVVLGLVYSMIDAGPDLADQRNAISRQAVSLLSLRRFVR